MSATLAPMTWQEIAAFFEAKTGIPVPPHGAPGEAAYEWMTAVAFEYCRRTHRAEVAARDAAELCRALPFASRLEPYVLDTLSQSQSGRDRGAQQ